jgi:hypothetical protein
VQGSCQGSEYFPYFSNSGSLFPPSYTIGDPLLPQIDRQIAKDEIFNEKGYDFAYSQGAYFIFKKFNKVQLKNHRDK